MEKGCQKGSPEAPTGGELLPTGTPPPTAPVSSCPSGHLCGYSGTSTPPIGGPGPGPGPVFYLSSPYTHHSYWQVFYLSSPYTHHSYWPVFYLSSLYTHHSTIPKNGRVVFLGKIKMRVACKRPHQKRDNPFKSDPGRLKTKK